MALMLKQRRNLPTRMCFRVFFSTLLMVAVALLIHQVSIAPDQFAVMKVEHIVRESNEMAPPWEEDSKSGNQNGAGYNNEEEKSIIDYDDENEEDDNGDDDDDDDYSDHENDESNGNDKIYESIDNVDEINETGEKIKGNYDISKHGDDFDERDHNDESNDNTNGNDDDIEGDLENDPIDESDDKTDVNDIIVDIETLIDGSDDNTNENDDTDKVDNNVDDNTDENVGDSKDGDKNGKSNGEIEENKYAIEKHPDDQAIEEINDNQSGKIIESPEVTDIKDNKLVQDATKVINEWSSKRSQLDDYREARKTGTKAFVTPIAEPPKISLDPKNLRSEADNVAIKVDADQIAEGIAKVPDIPDNKRKLNADANKNLNSPKTADQVGKYSNDVAEPNSNVVNREDTKKGIYSLANPSVLKHALQNTAANNTIIISVLDFAYLHLAINLITTSFRPHGITNFIFICLSKEAQLGMERFGVRCLLHEVETETHKPSIFGSKAFIEKTLVKPLYVLEALKLNYDVWLVDLDIVFFKNPLIHMKCDVREFDICIQLDSIRKDRINSGFYLVHPTRAGIKVHQKIMDILGNDPSTRVQQVMYELLREMGSKREIRTKPLDIFAYPPGKIYFELGHRMFRGENPCTNCVIVHNNWIRHEEAKVYRMKETGLWSVDVDGYFSNPDRKYLTFSNPLNFGNLTATLERNALQVSLLIGKLLNRTVILPRYCCDGCNSIICDRPRRHCTISSQFLMRDFDRYFAGKYRENQFLEHNMVPRIIKRSMSPLLVVDTSPIFTAYSISKFAAQFNLTLGKIKSQLFPKDAKIFRPMDTSQGTSSHEIVQWFLNSELNKYSVLNFHSLYFALSRISDEHQDEEFQTMLSKGLTGADYRQNIINRKFEDLNSSPFMPYVWK